MTLCYYKIQISVINLHAAGVVFVSRLDSLGCLHLNIHQPLSILDYTSAPLVPGLVACCFLVQPYIYFTRYIGARRYTGTL